uniref:Immunoglobulin-like beta-sandwich domain-containing protein n=1 Tax=Pongo abelii TaxID=9601 RepID=A0A8I5UFA7_PONAB
WKEGVHRKPSLLALPGPLVKSEETVILQCWSDVVFEYFLLHRDGKFNDTLRLIGELHDGVSKVNFSIGPMMPTLAGTYRCYGSLPHSPYEWSAPSDPLDIMMTGLYEKPSLSAQPGPTVQAGEKVTLSCSSRSSYDMYHLSREGGAMNLGSLQCPRSTEHSRQTFLWALSPTEGPTDALALSVTLPTSGQTRVTHCLFLSQVRKPHICLISYDPKALAEELPADDGEKHGQMQREHAAWV